ncbi:glycosyltransferase [Myxococcaceae bacterium GXIMD 01537]
MRILVLMAAPRTQFSPIFDELSRAHEVTVLAPERFQSHSGRGVVVVSSRRRRTSLAVESTRQVFLGAAAAVHRSLQDFARDSFDVVFGQASFGCSARVRERLDAALVSHVEFPGNELAMARPDFPLADDERDGHRAQRALVMRSLRASDLVITNSWHARNALPRSLHPRVRISMEGFGVPPLRTAEERTALRRAHGLPVDVPLVGYFGRTLEAMRGFDVFVKSAREIRRRRADAAFLVVGNPISYYGYEGRHLGGESFRDFSLRQGQMRESDFLFRPIQPIAEMRELMAAVDVALFPLFETPGNGSFYECLAAGTPVVAARRCFFPEVIEEGQNGFLCDVNDADAFADRAVTLLSNESLRRELGARGHALIQAEHTVERAAARYGAFIDEAVRRHRDASGRDRR